MFQLAIIADDLTGSMDTGVQFAKRGLRTVVSLVDRLAAGVFGGADVLVLNTNSRQDSPEEAGRKVLACGRYVRELGVRRAYKKIDSTLRGNIGAELDALLDAWGVPTALMTPAFPAVGRSVVGGLLLVNGVPWERTQYAPPGAATSCVADVVGSRRLAASVELAEVSRGEDTLAARLRELAGRGAGIIVADAADAADLGVIARALAGAGLDQVICGSGGLAEELPAALGIVSGQTVGRIARAVPNKPVLVVAGTVNPVTIQQVRHAQKTLAPRVVEILPASLARDPAVQRSRLEQACQESLDEGRDLLIATVPLSASPETSLQERNSAVAEALGPVVAEAVARHQWSGLVMTGGDTAISLCEALGANALEIEGEVEPGVPCGRLLQGPLAGLLVVTKAGGFGSPEAIAKAITFIRGRIK
ncbi:MAG: hypothetical protein M1401_15195 [Chloroflexi bacterium]|nr:hypothetical protein [Chloroflexota bacterium]MCL5110173.1 hypothetical protein [Chloroflexota bacterium]